MINSIIDDVMTFSISKVQDNHMYKNVRENKIKKEEKKLGSLTKVDFG